MSRRLGLLVLIAAVALPAPAGAQSQPGPKARSLARDHAAAAGALERAQDLRAGRGVVNGRELTPALARLAARYDALTPAERREADRLLARPTDGAGDPQGDGWTVPEHAPPFCSANFCIHWVESTADAPDLTDTDADGAPDYVETMAAEFEFSRTRENTDLGWRAPVSDGARGGNGRLDVYLVDLTGTGILGYATTDPGQADPHEKFGYMVMDEDYDDQGDPLEVLQVTAAHEYNHILQFAYDALQDSWFFEATAVWMEDLVYDGADHYLGFIPTWATLDEIPLARNFQNKHYGSAVWNMWLDARHGPALIRSAWQGSSAAAIPSFAPSAYHDALVAGGHPGFSASFGSFSAAVAEWRTASEFPEGAAYTDAQRRGSLQVGASVRPQLDHTTYAMYTVPQPAGGWPAVLRLDGELPAGVTGALALVGRTGSDPLAGAVTTELQQLPAGGGGSIQLEDPAAFVRITAVLVNADTDVTGFANGDWVFAADAQPFSAAAAPSASTASAPANSTLPIISGTPRHGDTLSATTGGWTGSAPMDYDRQWRRCDDDTPQSCTDIAGATGPTYTATEADIGKRLRVRVTATNPVSSAEAESAPTAAVVAIPPANITPPVIDDTTPVVGQTLNTTDGTWSGSQPMTITYQWQRCAVAGGSCANIAGAAAAAYEVVDADAEKFLRVAVTADNSAPGSTTRNSASTQKVTGSAPANTALPTVAGTERDGETLTAADGTWTGSPTLSRKWLRCTDVTIGSCAETGQTGGQYVLGEGDVGRRMRVRVTATNGAGSTDADSAATGVIAALAPSPVSAPVISGTPTDGQTLTTTNGTWSGTAPAFARAWLSCDDATIESCEPTGATGTQYALQAADVGSRMRVRVTATNGAGTAESTSDPTAAVAAAAPAPVSAPVLSDSSPTEGDELTSTDGGWSGTAPLDFTREWLRCEDGSVPSCAAIAGATGDAYTTGAADVGKRIRARVHASNTAGDASALSEPTDPVAAKPVAPANTVAPSITGTPAVGSELTSLMGSWTGTAPITITRRWQRCTSGGLSCADIPGAVGEKYTPTLADVLAQLRVVVTASNVAGTASAPSALVGPVPQPASTGGGGTGGSGGGGAPATPAGPPTPPPAVAALAATVKAPAKAKLAAALAGKLAVPVDCSAACRVAARVELKKAAARKLGVPAVIARGSRNLAGAGRASVKLAFASKARKKLRKARRVVATLVVEVRDATGALAAQRRVKLTMRR